MSLSYYTRDGIREFLVSLYGAQANSWNINNQVGAVVYEMVRKSSQCSATMNWVPRPLNPFSNPFTQIAKQQIKAFINSLLDNKEHYVACLRAASLNHKSKIYLASQGV